MMSQYWFSYHSINQVYSFQSGIYQYLFFTLILLSTGISGSDWNIKCRFAEKNSNVFWAGGNISGFIDFVNTDHSNLILERINAELVGEIVYKIVKKINKTESKQTSQSKFVRERIVLHPIGSQGKFSVPYGNHSWPFHFQLNDLLPPSLNQSDSNAPRIHYLIQTTFVRPQWYKSNKERNFPIVVKRLPSYANATKFEIEKSNRKGAILRVVLHKNAVVAGNNFSFEVDLNNWRENYIRRISVTLNQHLELTPYQKKQTNIVRRDLENIQKFKGKYFNGTFQLHVPQTTPATFSFNFTSNSVKQRLVIRYDLHFEVHLRGLFTNIQLPIPVIITNTMPKNQ